MKPLKRELKQRMKPKPVEKPRFEGKGTKARLNTAAEKMMFGRKSS